MSRAQAYVVPMANAVESMVAATYVRNLEASRAFYELLGFREVRSGASPDSAFSELASDVYDILLVVTSPPLELARLPLLYYFFYADLAAQLAALTAAGATFEHLGFPPHALGGEVRLTDPDGNTVLAGQRLAEPACETRAGGTPASQLPADRLTAGSSPADGAAAGARPADDEGSRFSLLREAAAAVAERGTPGIRCQVSGEQWVPCGEAAEVRIADPSGDTVWACLGHADEILVSVPGAFLTSPEERGIAAFLATRRR
jgi:catechol 2,3-dioxygenase-like lactoylglutathione lyase family enzyme